MGNNLNHNPLIIDTAMGATDFTRDVYITGFYWTGLSAADTLSVKDTCASAKQIWKAVASANGLDVQYTPEQPIPAKGIYVDDIPGSQSSMLLIYLKSRL